MLKEFGNGIGTIGNNWEEIKTWISPEKETDPHLRFINWFIHHGCNLDCPYCKTTKQHVPTMNDSGRKEALTRLKTLSGDRTIISLIGGEPTLNPDFLLDVVSDAVDAGFIINITTNGYRLDDDLIGKLARLKGDNKLGVRQIAISVDCQEPKKDLHQALDLLEAVRDVGIMSTINTVITNQTDPKEFRKLTNTIIKEGHFISPQIVTPKITGGSFSNASFEDQITKRQIAEIIPFLLWKKMTTGQVTATIGHLWAIAKLYWSEEGRPGLWHCVPNFRSHNQRGRGHLAMDSDGLIGPCQEFPRLINILDVDPKLLQIKFLDSLFRETTQMCRGCMYNCYINEDELRGPRSALGELPTAMAIAAALRGGSSSDASDIISEHKSRRY